MSAGAPGASPLTRAVVLAAPTVMLAVTVPATSVSTRNELMVDPLAPPGVQETIAALSRGSAATPDGAKGTPAGVAAADDAEGPVPTPLVAETVKV